MQAHCFQRKRSKTWALSKSWRSVEIPVEELYRWCQNERTWLQRTFGIQVSCYKCVFRRFTLLLFLQPWSLSKPVLCLHKAKVVRLKLVDLVSLRLNFSVGWIIWNAIEVYLFISREVWCFPSIWWPYQHLWEVSAASRDEAEPSFSNSCWWFFNSCVSSV